jgi:hypothetical protein
MADTKDPKPVVPPREDRGRDDSKPIESAAPVTEEQRHNTNVTAGWGQANQGDRGPEAPKRADAGYEKQEDNWGNQGNQGNEGYFQGVQDKTTNLPGEAAAARNLKPDK